jgi:hypothetical protein
VTVKVASPRHRLSFYYMCMITCMHHFCCSQSVVISVHTLTTSSKSVHKFQPLRHGMDHMPPRLVVYCHICTIGDYSSIVRRQLVAIETNGLSNVLTMIVIGILSPLVADPTATGEALSHIAHLLATCTTLTASQIDKRTPGAVGIHTAERATLLHLCGGTRWLPIQPLCISIYTRRG